MEKKKDIIALMDEALKGDIQPEETVVQIKKLKLEFVELVRVDHDSLKVVFVKEGGEEDEFKPPHDEWDGQFSDLMTKFNLKKKKWDELAAQTQVENLKVKKKIIADLQALIKEEQHIGHAFEKFNALKELWKKTGDVSVSEYKDLQREYSHAFEEFFYNINIYKTLKEYDLKKNLQLKVEMTEKVKSLMDVKNVREIRDMISAYVKEWDEIGPTYQNKWEKTRDDYWAAVRDVYKKIGDHYQDQKNHQKENFELKSLVCDKMEALSIIELENQKHWNKIQKDLNEVQEEWKKIGFAGKGKNDQIWDRFRDAQNKIYEKKRDLFSDLKDDYKEVEAKKLILIAKVKALKDSTEWKDTAEDLKRIQAEWKRIGTAFPSKEQRLWKTFRSATDHFFNKRQEFFDGREDREKANLEQKEALLKKLQGLKDGTGKEQIVLIDEIGKEWNLIGYVPVKEKKRIEEAYQKQLSAKLKASGLDNTQIEDKTFALKLDGIKDSDNADTLMRNEYKALRDKLVKIEASINQYENNLGFFGGDVENNPLVKDVYDKLNSSKEEALKIKSRIQMINS